MEKCPYCKQEISEEAEKCQHCGSIVEKSSLGRTFGWLFVFLFVFQALSAFVVDGRVLVGALYVLATALVLPPVYQGFIAERGWSNQLTAVVVVVFVTFFLESVITMYL